MGRRQPGSGDGVERRPRTPSGRTPVRGDSSRRRDDSRSATPLRRDSSRSATTPRAEEPVVRKPWLGGGELPRWVQDEVSRVTAKARIPGTLELLQQAAGAFAGGKHGKARHLLEEAKELSPRTATIRELLGLSAYRLARWEQALQELRTFRRLTGESTHMPVEMDVLRALDRPADVEATWQSFRRIGGDRSVEREARVVYGSFLLDQGRDREAWQVTDPTRLTPKPHESELRVWFVAARAAARLGDFRTARRFYEAIQRSDPGFPALDELDRATQEDGR